MKITECTRKPQPIQERHPVEQPEAAPQDVFERQPVLVERPPMKTERKPPDKPPGPFSKLAAQLEEKNQDWQSAREILARVHALRRLTDERILAMLADLSTQIFTIWQEVMARRRKACDEALARWSKLMFE